jgi:hypothetical protein
MKRRDILLEKFIPIQPTAECTCQEMVIFGHIAVPYCTAFMVSSLTCVAVKFSSHC